MATRTFTNGGVNNLWSTAGNWDTPPVDDDTVVIASGQTCEYDADWSSAVTYPNGLNGLTITGTLKISTTTSSYMKMKAATYIGGAGTFNIGESGAGAIPFAVKFTLTGGAGWYITGTSGLTMTVYGAEPSIKTIKLSGAEAIGQTELSVDTNVTGDIWADGDTIRIDDIAQDNESEERTIAAGGIAVGAITVTAGLTAAKLSGALVHLMTRNIKIIGVGAGTRLTAFASGKLIIGGGMFSGGTSYTIGSCVDLSITGGTFNNTSSYIIRACSGINTISGGVFSGCVGVINSGNVFVSGGTFSGNTDVFINYNGSYISGGWFSGNKYIVDNCTPCTIIGGTFENSSRLFYICTGQIRVANITANNFLRLLENCINADFQKVTLTAVGTENYAMTALKTSYIEMQGYNGVDGAFKAFSYGGIVTSQTSIKPTGYTQAYLQALSSAAFECWWKKGVTVAPGESITIEVQLRKSASMAYLPRAYLVYAYENPVIGSTPVDSFTMTDSTDTWESDTFTIDNSAGTTDLEYTLWFVAKNASGSVYSAYNITTATGAGGGAVKIMPLGRVGL